MSRTVTTTEQKTQEDSTLLKQVRFIKALTADPDLAPFGKIVANTLIFTFWNRDEGKARPGHARLAKEAGTTVSSVKRGVQSLKDRGWFVVEPAMDEHGDPAPNHYYPIWKRAEGKAPAGSEKPKKARPKPSELFAFEAGHIRLTSAEYTEIEKRVGDLSWPFFDDLRKKTSDWSEHNWRSKLADLVVIYETDDEVDDTPLGEDKWEPGF